MTGSATGEPPNLRRTVVLGAINNLIFAVAGGALTFGQFVLVLRLAGPAQIGLYAMASVFATTIESISEFGIGDRLIQREDEHFRESYSVAATAHFLLSLALWILILLCAPAIARFYKQPQLWPLLSVMSYAAFSGVARLPLSLLLREFKYFQQRLLMFLGKVAGFVVTVALAYTGHGVWALVTGSIVTLAVTCVPAWLLLKVRPSWRIDGAELRALLNFSGPLWIGRLTMILVQQGTIFVLSLYLTTTEVGQYKAAEQIVFFLVSIDIILGQTIFPALCKVRNAPEQIGAGFTKASRASMLWIAGIGGAMFIFADAVVRFILTAKWSGAELFVQAQGLALIVGGVAYSWGFLFEVRGETRPILKVIAAFGGAFVVLFAPLTWAFGRRGAASGIVAVCLVGLLAKQYYIAKLGMGVSVVEIARRSLTAVLLACGSVLAIRRILHPDLTAAAVLAQIALYGTVYALVLIRLERNLLIEVLQVVRHRAKAGTALVSAAAEA